MLHLPFLCPILFIVRCYSFYLFTITQNWNKITNFMLTCRNSLRFLISRPLFSSFWFMWEVILDQQEVVNLINVDFLYSLGLGLGN